MKIFTEKGFEGIAAARFNDEENGTACFLAVVLADPFPNEDSDKDETTFAVFIQERPLTFEANVAGETYSTGVDWNAETWEGCVFNWLDAGSAFPETLDDVRDLLESDGVTTDYRIVKFLNPRSAENIGIDVDKLLEYEG